VKIGASENDSGGLVMARKGPSSVDKIVGRNIRIYRLAKGISQTDLGDSLDITFQQIQKYEHGANRVGSGRLFKIASVLEVPVTAFFEGTDGGHQSGNPRVFGLLAEPHSIQLIEAFSEIKDPKIRRSIVTLVRTIAQSDGHSTLSDD
jgi:transcriptional regulator with XRE-family HTH domain